MERLSLKKMEENAQEGIISLVNSIFEVSDFTKAEFSLEFKIEDLEFKSKFVDLARKLENMSYGCKLQEIEGVRMYEKLGFVIRQQLNAYYRDGEDAYLMAIEFN